MKEGQGDFISGGYCIRSKFSRDERHQYELHYAELHWQEDCFEFQFYGSFQYIDCITKEFLTDKKHYTIIGATVQKNLIENTITGAFQEREHGITMDYITDEFLTDKCHYNIIDTSGLEDFIRNRITGASQDDVVLTMAPIDGNLNTAIADGCDLSFEENTDVGSCVDRDGTDGNHTNEEKNNNVDQCSRTAPRDNAESAVSRRRATTF